MPSEHLQPLAAGIGILRCLPDRPHRHADEADHRLFQQQPGHGVRPQGGRGRSVNVGFDVYRIETKITKEGRRWSASRGNSYPHRDRRTRKKRFKELDNDLTYTANDLDRDVVAEDQIRLVIQTFRDRLFTDIFPGRTEVPKTLVFAKDDSHAEDITRIIREEFGEGNDFCQKITYKTTGRKPEDILAEFRNSFNPRIAVTVDMIATGTDVKPLECLLFLRNVKSAGYFDQMKGRGVRVVDPDTLQSVTPDASAQNPLRHRRCRWAFASRTRPTRSPSTASPACRSTKC